MPHIYRTLSMAAFVKALRGGQDKPSEASLQLGILTYLRHAGRPVATHELIDWLYGDDPDGGAEYAARGIAVVVHKLRGRGIPIRTNGWRGYSLDPIRPSAAADVHDQGDAP